MQKDWSDEAPVLPLQEQCIIFRSIGNQDPCQRVVISILYINRITGNIVENGREGVCPTDLCHSICCKEPYCQGPHYYQPGCPGDACQAAFRLICMQCCLVA